MTYDAEHLFICLFAICISSLVSSPDLLLIFKLSFFVVLLNFKSSLYILDTWPLSDMYFANIFLNLCLAFSSSLWSLLFSCQFHFRKLLSRYTWGHIRHSSKKFATSLFVEAKWRGKKQCVGDYGTYNHRKLFSCFSEYEVFLHNC